MKIDIISIFPQVFEGYFGESILGRAQKAGIVKISAFDLRQWTTDKHHKVDDTPYGGGAGMVLKVEPIYSAVTEIKSKSASEKTRTILLSAKGKRFTQADAKRLAEFDHLIFVCGRYEGVDERVAKHVVDEELSIGDFVLTGGEVATMAVVDAVVRLLPGALGNDTSAETESHSEQGYLEHDQYTKPEDFQGWKVPDVLLSGNHKLIEQWRKQNSKDKNER